MGISWVYTGNIPTRIGCNRIYNQQKSFRTVWKYGSIPPKLHLFYFEKYDNLLKLGAFPKYSDIPSLFSESTEFVANKRDLTALPATRPVIVQNSGIPSSAMIYSCTMIFAISGCLEIADLCESDSVWKCCEAWERTTRGSNGSSWFSKYRDFTSKCGIWWEIEQWCWHFAFHI